MFDWLRGRRKAPNSGDLNTDDKVNNHAFDSIPFVTTEESLRINNSEHEPALVSSDSLSPSGGKVEASSTPSKAAKAPVFEDPYADEPAQTTFYKTANGALMAASVRGTSHQRRGQPRQDRFTFAAEEDHLIAVVADGLGSHPLSHLGAEAVCEGFVKWFRERLSINRAEFLSLLTLPEKIEEADCELKSAVRAISDSVRAIECEHGQAAGATMVATITFPSGGIFVHVGDGNAFACNSEYDGSEHAFVASPPENGEYENVTYPVTYEPLEPHIRITRFERCQRIVLMTDGTAPFAIASDRFSPARQFFAKLDPYLWRERNRDRASNVLEVVLNDPRSRAVSDDDMTLLIVAYE
jgi:serine/threonine protein phosphatase PrpC